MKALIIMIFNSKMEMPMNMIRNIISIDQEFHMNTGFLKQKNDISLNNIDSYDDIDD